MLKVLILDTIRKQIHKHSNGVLPQATNPNVLAKVQHGLFIPMLQRSSLVSQMF